MQMSPFDNLYGNSIDYLRKSSSTIPELSSGTSANLFLHKYDDNIIALMVTMIRNPTSRDIELGRTVPLQDILNNLPMHLREGSMSWLMLNGEEESSSLIIHTGITEEELAMFAMPKLLSITAEKMRESGSSILHLGKIKEEVRDKMEEVREQAKKSLLVNSEPVAHYISEQTINSRKPFGQERLTQNTKSSIVIQLPIETVFAYVSQPEHFIPEKQGNEIEYMRYRLFSLIPITLKTRRVQIKEILQKSEGPPGAGTIFVRVMTLQGVAYQSLIEMTEYEPPHVVAFRFSVPYREIRYMLEPVAGGTKVTKTVALRKGSGCLYQLHKLILTPEEKQGTENVLGRLKERLENRSRSE